MKNIANIVACAAFAAGLSAIAPAPAWSHPGQDFPNTKCTCKGCGPNGGDVTGQCATVCKDKEVYGKGSEPYDYCKAKALISTGANLRAAMALAGINAATLARDSRVSTPTVAGLLSNRVRQADPSTIRKISKGLEARGVQITEDGPRLIKKPRR